MMASAIFLTKPQAVSVMEIGARLSDVQTGACMPMAVGLVHARGSSHSAELPLERMWGFACAVVPVRMGKHFLQLVLFVANEKSKEPIPLKTNCFEVA